MSEVYKIVVRQIQKPGRGKNHYYPAEVRVMDTRLSEWHAVRGLNDGIKYRQEVCGTAYSGPRSEFGKAMRKAKEICDRLNATAVAQS